MSVKLVVGDCTLNVVSAYAPQAGLDEEAKRHFLGSKARDTNGYKLWYSEVVKGKNEVGILVDRDIIESVVKVRSSAGGYVEVYGGFGFGVRNGGGTSLLQFTKAFELMIANSSFSKREEHLVTFQCIVVKIQIDYFLLIKYDRGLYEDCKVIPGTGGKVGDKKLYQMAKVIERKARNLDQVRCIKDKDGRVLIGEAQIKQRWQTYFYGLLNEERDKDIVLGNLGHSESL
uniref:Craniofacial development protein 2-like n=1 Tax=Nicotiana tabacum TaxID=4097 RepID=A0A1S4BYB3_TOBAC|nr:PREDICTED: uncharacterized protein LOC107813182 [Nicotiana tabacum]